MQKFAEGLCGQSRKIRRESALRQEAFCFDMRDTRRASALTEALHGEKSAAVPGGR